jgi:hypothetical protein
VDEIENKSRHASLRARNARVVSPATRTASATARIAKRRRKTLYETLRRHLGEVFHRLAGQKESRIEEGHLMPHHVHMLIAIPPSYVVSQVIGYIKG